MKRALVCLLGVFSFSLPLVAQSDLQTITSDQLQTTGEVDAFPALSLYRPDLFSSANGSLLLHDLPVLVLLDGRRLSISQDNRFDVASFFSVGFLSAVSVQTDVSPMYGTDALGGIVNLQTNRTYSGGQAGVFYGGSGGKIGGQDFSSYIIGSVGTDRFQITAGAAYEKGSGGLSFRVNH
ncbi:MAG TPA: hypothetical protein VGG02_08150 [Chthoniobacterales bacterium]|jgi:outer membrane receptor protein involved in Fe transport